MPVTCERWDDLLIQVVPLVEWPYLRCCRSELIACGKSSLHVQLVVYTYLNTMQHWQRQ